MALGDTIYRGALVWKRLLGNTTTTPKFLRQVGDGANSAAPSWEAVSLDALSDVGITSPLADGDVLTYNAASPAGWVNAQPAAGGALNDLTDVVITTPTSDEILKYNGTTWVNGAVPGSSASISILAKAADETVNNSDVFQNDDHFSFSVAANEKWLVDLHFIITAANTTADFKVQWTVPTGATYYLAPLGVSCWEGVTTTVTPNALSTTYTAVGSMNGTFGATIRSVLLIGGTAGTAQVQWAQSTANATNLTVKAGSFMVRMKG